MVFQSRIGLALGGGGARGIAHLGVLQHFHQINLKIDAIAGTSAGAIVGALYAFGTPLRDIEEDLRNLKPTNFSSLRLPKLGLFKNEQLRVLLEKRLPRNAQIQDAPIPLEIKATDIETVEGILMTRGNLIEAVMASSCVPGIYIPVEINGRLLVDGGLTENVPLSALKKLGANIQIGVNLNGNKRYNKPDSLLDILSNSLDIAIDNQTRSQLNLADLVISMDLSRYGRFHLEAFDDLVFEGRKSAREAIRTARWLGWRHRFRQIWAHLSDISPIKIPERIKKILQQKELIPRWVEHFISPSSEIERHERAEKSHE